VNEIPGASPAEATNLVDVATPRGPEGLVVKRDPRDPRGFGSKGVRAKEIMLDLAEATRVERPGVDEQLVDFGMVGPGPRRALNFVNNRRWFDNGQDRTPRAAAMRMGELRGFRYLLLSHTDIAELKTRADEGGRGVATICVAAGGTRGARAMSCASRKDSGRRR